MPVAHMSAQRAAGTRVPLTYDRYGPRIWTRSGTITCFCYFFYTAYGADGKITRKEYPHQCFRKHWDLGTGLACELGQCQTIIEAISRIPLLPESRRRPLELSLSAGAQASTAIEGNTLSLDEVRRIYLGRSFARGKEYQDQRIRNVLSGFNMVLRETVSGDRMDRITPGLLKHFHSIVGSGLWEYFRAVPGGFASAGRVVGPYVAPDHEDVPELVDRLCTWLPVEFPRGSGQMLPEAIIQAIVAHVYIEWIHPFDDGNGRTGRFIECYILIRAGCPDIASHILSNHYNETRPEYYHLLSRAGRERDLTSFLEYAVRGLRDGLRKTLQAVQASQFKMSWMKLVHDSFAGRKMTNRHTFSRQRALMLELPPEPVSVHAIRRISPTMEALFGDLSDKTIRRDLKALEELDLVVREADDWRPKTELLGAELARRRRV